jgi:hypothetical protein
VKIANDLHAYANGSPSNEPWYQYFLWCVNPDWENPGNTAFWSNRGGFLEPHPWTGHLNILAETADTTWQQFEWITFDGNFETIKSARTELYATALTHMANNPVGANRATRDGSTLWRVRNI